LGVRGLGRLFLRGGPNGVWWYQFSLFGKQYRVSTGLRGPRDKKGNPPKDVQLWAANKLTDLGKGGAPREEALTFEHLADALVARYRAEERPSLQNLINRLKPLRKHFAGKKARTITPSDIAGYAARRRDVDQAAVATINLEIAYAARAFSVAVEDNLLSRTPKFHKLPGEHVRQGIIEEEAFRDIVMVLAEKYRAVAWFLKLTGWRRSEPCKLRWAQVSWEARDLLLLKSKTREPRRLPFGKYPALYQLLQRQLEYRDELQAKLGRVIEWVFPQPDGRKTSPDAFYEAWKTACRATGYPDAMLHDFRRSVARKGELARVPQKVTMALRGVTTLDIFSRYAVLKQRDLEDGLASFAEAEEPEAVIRKFRSGQEGG
jgi:integrase